MEAEQPRDTAAGLPAATEMERPESTHNQAPAAGLAGAASGEAGAEPVGEARGAGDEIAAQATEKAGEPGATEEAGTVEQAGSDAAPMESPGSAEMASEEEAPVEIDADALLGTAVQPETAAESGEHQLKAVIEAVVYVLPEPLPAAQIAAALNEPVERVEKILQQLMEEMAREERGVFLREVAGGYQIATKPEHHEAIRAFVKNLKQPLKLSNAALETLAVIAYKQPVTAPEIMEIRGVQGVGVLKTLLERKLIVTAGRKNVIGKPMLYKTTKEFLTQFGLNSISELPTLKEFEEIRRQSIAEDDAVAEVVTGEVVRDEALVQGRLPVTERSDGEAPAEAAHPEPGAAAPAPGDQTPGGNEPGDDAPATEEHDG